MWGQISAVCQNKGILITSMIAGGFGFIGLLGAHTIKILLPAVNPAAVASVCGMCPMVVIGVIALAPEDAFINSLGIGIIFAYPLAFFTTKVFSDVCVIYPPVCFVAGTGMIAGGSGVIAIAYLIFNAVPKYF